MVGPERPCLDREQVRQRMAARAVLEFVETPIKDIIEEMARSGLHPDTITINTLLDAHCRAGMLERAWLLFESMLMPLLTNGQQHGVWRRARARGLAASFPVCCVPLVAGVRMRVECLIVHLKEESGGWRTPQRGVGSPW